MGFYFKKILHFGPFRINFSKSGISISLGVKGASVNIGPKRSYINVGRKGLYYKKSIDNKQLFSRKK